MRRTTVLLACLLVTLPVTAMADGLVRFSGRIVDAPCAASIPAPGELVLDGCPMAAEGSRLSVVALGNAAAVQLEDLDSGAIATRIPVAAAAIDANRHNFSSRYRIHPDGPTGAYMVRIDYL